jgi:hypothetical protein
MLRRLSMQSRRRCVMLRGRQPTFDGACRRWRTRMHGSDMNLVDGKLRMTVHQHGPIGCMLVILARLGILRSLPMN